MSKNIRALLFDMDGVLINSEPLQIKAGCIAVERMCGIRSAQELFKASVGISNRVVWQWIVEKYGVSQSYAAFEEEQLKALFALLDRPRNAVPIEGIPEILETLKASGIPAAVVSSSSRRLIECVLQKLGIAQFFEVIVAGEDVERHKPDPEGYLKASALLEIDPECCAVIEDSPSGVSAAKSAGCFTVGFINPDSGAFDLSRADAVVRSMSNALELLRERI